VKRTEHFPIGCAFAGVESEPVFASGALRRELASIRHTERVLDDEARVGEPVRPRSQSAKDAQGPNEGNRDHDHTTGCPNRESAQLNAFIGALCQKKLTEIVGSSDRR